MAEDVYEKLRERLDSFFIGYPKTEGGVEIKMLQKVYNEEEAELALQLKLLPETAEQIAERLGMDKKELADKLYALSKKGGIFRSRRGDSLAYSISISEAIFGTFRLGDVDKEFAEMSEEYGQEAYLQEMCGSERPYLRVVPTEKEIPAQLEVYPYERVSDMIDRANKVSVMDCFCRTENKLLGKGCDKPVNVCMTFSEAAEYFIENGIGREISKEEALKLLDEAEEAGLVHCSMNTFSEHRIICNCCGCCCGFLRGLNDFKITTAVAKSNLYAEVDQNKCTACGTCVDRCQVGAITCEGDYSVMTKELCIGCGLCISSCQSAARSFIRKSEEEWELPSEDLPNLFMDISKGKNRPFTL